MEAQAADDKDPGDEAEGDEDGGDEEEDDGDDQHLGTPVLHADGRGR